MSLATTITRVEARQSFDCCKENPTIAVGVTTQQGVFSVAVPLGATMCIREAIGLGDYRRALGCRDGKDAGFHHKCVLVAIDGVNKIIGPNIIGMDPREQDKIDKFIKKQQDTIDKLIMMKVGDTTFAPMEYVYLATQLACAKTMLGVSLAVARAGAAVNGISLYQQIANLSGNKELVLPPAVNIINGGSHAGNASQQFIMLPTGANSLREAMIIDSEVYDHLKKVIKKKSGQDVFHVGDQAGFVPNIQSSEEACQMIMEAIELAGYKDKVVLGTNAAASEFCTKDDEKKEFKDNSSEWVNQSDDLLVEKIGALLGDDLLVANLTFPKGIKENVYLINFEWKVNQIGSLSEAIQAVKIAKKAGWSVIASRTSSETEDTFIADLAVGLFCKWKTVFNYNEFYANIKADNLRSDESEKLKNKAPELREMVNELRDVKNKICELQAKINRQELQINKSETTAQQSQQNNMSGDMDDDDDDDEKKAPTEEHIQLRRAKNVLTHENSGDWSEDAMKHYADAMKQQLMFLKKYGDGNKQ